MIREQIFVTEHLDNNGFRTGDDIKVCPAAGKHYTFKFNRTCFDFLSDSLYDSITSLCKKRLVGMRNEHFHIKVYLQKVTAKNNAHRERVFLEVIEGPAVRLNGHFVFKALIEKGDICDIGHNRIHFESLQAPESKGSMKFIMDKYSKLFRSELPVLIQGETGVGKTLLAKRIHEHSNRRGHFIHLNIASYPQNLVESELFGHVKGAFTGAISEKRGAFKLAEGGTLFLDEIDSLSEEIQIKLLLFLDNYEFKAIGAEKSQNIKTRVIFASGQNLLKLVEKNKMRRDFYFRLSSGQTINLKPLREKKESIRLFCEEFSQKENIMIDRKLVKFYESFDWPGNYRQLASHLKQKKVLSSKHKLSFDDLDQSLAKNHSSWNLDQEKPISLKQLKLSYAKQIYYRCEQNYTRAASILGVSSRSLRELLRCHLEVL